MIQVDLKNAEKRFNELIELAASGEDVVISQDNEPLVRLASVVRQKRQRQFGSAKGLIVMAEDLTNRWKICGSIWANSAPGLSR